MNANAKRINESKNEGEMWKVVNDIINPNSEQQWKLKEGDNFFFIITYLIGYVSHNHALIIINL